MKKTLKAADPKIETNDADYVFISFVLNYLPHGVIGLLIAVILCAAMSSSASELNALGSTTVVDFYRPLLHPQASEEHQLLVSKLLTAAWGGVAISFALFANLVENLIQAINILGSIFYGSILGIFLVAFFLKFVRGTAFFIAADNSKAHGLGPFYRRADGVERVPRAARRCRAHAAAARSLSAWAGRWIRAWLRGPSTRNSRRTAGCWPTGRAICCSGWQQDRAQGRRRRWPGGWNIRRWSAR